MTNVMTETERRDLDVFRSIVNQVCAGKLAELGGNAFVAKCLGEPTPPDTAARQRLLDMPGNIKPGTRAELAAQWPADFPPLTWAFEARDDFALTFGLPPGYSDES
jgi:hypothetical protein